MPPVLPPQPLVEDSVSKPTLIIDGDIIAYKASASVERSMNWGEGIWTVHSFEEEGIAAMEAQIKTLIDTLNGGDTIFALSDGRSFRYDLYPAYKSNRKEQRKPLILPFLKEHLLENYRTYLRPRLEGDDILGILMTSKTIVKGDKIQVSIDKDQRCIPGKFYDQGRKEFRDISVEEADRFHLYQTLIGDATDGYPGCPGCGPKTAERLLEQHGATWATVVKAYEKAGLTEADALVQARVARILRNTDFDFDKKEPRLWTP